MVDSLLIRKIGDIDEEKLANIICKNYIDDSKYKTFRSRFINFVTKRVEVSMIYNFIKDLIMEAPDEHFDVINEFLKKNMKVELISASRQEVLDKFMNVLLEKYLPLKSDKLKRRKEKAMECALLIKDLVFRLAECLGSPLKEIEKNFKN